MGGVMALPNEEEDSRHHTQQTLEHAQSAGTSHLLLQARTSWVVLPLQTGV
jgi:hypothetical protein